jgi:hypothetical protein
VNRFYYYLLHYGYPVNVALDMAAFDTHIETTYDDCGIDDWYQIPDPWTQELVWSRMRICGDSSARLPR